jgi:hypothetical protein
MEKMETALQRQLENFRNLAKTAPPQKAEVIHLPVWKDQQRGVANVCLRSALFAAIHGNRRKAMQRELLASQNGIAIRFTGIQLDQSDLDVWEQALHLARQHPLGVRCEFTAHAFLKSLGRHTGKWQHEWLKEVFARLSSAVVEITKGERETYFGHLIDEGARDEVTGRYVLQLNPKLAALYAEGWTAIDWEQRRLLQRKPLALWLHSFLATHAQPFPLKVETLQRLSGSQTQEKWKFKQNLKAALEELLTIGAIVSYRFAGELLHVERVPSPSQQRHLQKKARTYR